MNATNPTRVVAFDTDMTVDYAGGPVPLDHVIELRDDPDVLVWATGFNQTLRDRAEIPGMHELKERRTISAEFIDRADRMRLLKREFPNAQSYTVVDDVDLRELEAEGWAYYQPAEYVIEELGITPSRWGEELGINVSDYLARIGKFPGHFPKEDLDLTTEMPYSARTRTGVRTDARAERERRQERESVDRGSPSLDPTNAESGGEYRSFIDVLEDAVRGDEDGD